jgi:hypothetical protein
MNGNAGNISKENKLKSYKLKARTKESEGDNGEEGKSMSQIGKEIDDNNVHLDTAGRSSGKKNGG